MNPVDPSLELRPVAAVFAALAAGFAHMVVALSLATSVGPTLAVYALGALLAYGVFFALLTPRLGEAPAQRLGFARPSGRSALACVLLLASVLLTSEIDNAVRWLFPLPDAIREALAAPPPVRSPGAALREGIELVLVYVAVFPLIYEVFYRGIVQPALIARLGPVRGVLLTAAVEASAALANPLFLWAWPVVAARGALLGTLRYCSGSLLPALALHALMGAVEVGAQFEVFGIAGFDDLGAGHTPASWLVAAALPTALGLWLCRRLLLERRAASA
jgi:membrane protease YdiL (CAAX protease family)